VRLVPGLVVVAACLPSAIHAQTATFTPTWVQQSPATSPVARYISTMAYDAATGQIVVFGGVNNSFAAVNDTWVLQLGALNLGTANVCSGGTPTPCSTTLTLTYTFSGSSGTIKVPVVLTQGATGLDFTDAGNGTCTTNGTSHTYSSGNTCTVVVTFTPKVPGPRRGAVNLLNSSGALIVSTLVFGIGTGPLATFPGSTAVSVVGSGFSEPMARRWTRAGTSSSRTMATML